MAQAAVKDTTGYVNYVYNISARGTTEVASQLLGLSGMATNILGQLAFQTSSYLSTTEGALLSMGVIATAGFTKATQQAMEFDQALSTVGAISGKTRGEVASLGDDAMAMSSKFGVAVSEMTQGMESLARAGVSQGNMTAILEEAMGLSKLEGLTLDTAINDLISTTNLLDTQGLDLSSAEYADAIRYQNQKITATSEAAPINAQDIIHTLEHIGGYASSTNLDQDDLYAVIAQLGSKGTKSEMAGTSLRAFISAGQKDTAQRALARIGLKVSDLWKNDDTIMSITDMKDVLDEAMESRGYTQQEKLEFYSDFAGYKQANQIMKIDTQSAREFKEKIDHSWNMGQKIAQVIGTAETHVQGLIQAGTNLLTKVGEPFLPIISTIAWTLRTGIDMINAIPGSNLIIAGGLILASVKAISTIFNKIVPQIVAAKGNIGSIGGFFGTIKKDLKESYTIIKNINNTDWIQRQAHQNEMNHVSEDEKLKYWRQRTGKRLYGMTDVYRLEKRHGFTNDQPYIDWKRRERYSTRDSRNERHQTQNEPTGATESSNNRKDNKKSDCCDSIIQVMKEGFVAQIYNTNTIKDIVSDIYTILSGSIIDKSVIDDLKTNVFSVYVTNIGDSGFSGGGSRSSQSDTTLQGPKLAEPFESDTRTSSSSSKSKTKLFTKGRLDQSKIDNFVDNFDIFEYIDFDIFDDSTIEGKESKKIIRNYAKDILKDNFRNNRNKLTGQKREVLQKRIENELKVEDLPYGKSIATLGAEKLGSIIASQPDITAYPGPVGNLYQWERPDVSYDKSLKNPDDVLKFIGIDYKRLYRSSRVDTTNYLNALATFADIDVSGITGKNYRKDTAKKIAEVGSKDKEKEKKLKETVEDLDTIFDNKVAYHYMNDLNSTQKSDFMKSVGLKVTSNPYVDMINYINKYKGQSDQQSKHLESLFEIGNIIEMDTDKLNIASQYTPYRRDAGKGPNVKNEVNSATEKAIKMQGKTGYGGIGGHIRQIVYTAVEMAVQDDILEMQKEMEEKTGEKVSISDVIDATPSLVYPNRFRPDHRVYDDIGKESPDFLVEDETAFYGARALHNKNVGGNETYRNRTFGNKGFGQLEHYKLVYADEEPEIYYEKEMEELSNLSLQSLLALTKPPEIVKATEDVGPSKIGGNNTGTKDVGVAEVRNLPYLFEGTPIQDMGMRLPTHGRNMDNTAIMGTDYISPELALGDYNPKNITYMGQTIAQEVEVLRGFIRNDRGRYHEATNWALTQKRNREAMRQNQEIVFGAIAQQYDISRQDIMQMPLTSSQQKRINELYSQQEFVNIDQYIRENGEDAFKQLRGQMSLHKFDYDYDTGELVDNGEMFTIDVTPQEYQRRLDAGLIYKGEGDSGILSVNKNKKTGEESYTIHDFDALHYSYNDIKRRVLLEDTLRAKELESHNNIFTNEDNYMNWASAAQGRYSITPDMIEKSANIEEYKMITKLSPDDIAEELLNAPIDQIDTLLHTIYLYNKKLYNKVINSLKTKRIEEQGQIKEIESRKEDVRSELERFDDALNVVNHIFPNLKEILSNKEKIEYMKFLSESDRPIDELMVIAQRHGVNVGGMNPDNPENLSSSLYNDNDYYKDIEYDFVDAMNQSEVSDLTIFDVATVSDEITAEFLEALNDTLVYDTRALVSSVGQGVTENRIDKINKILNTDINKDRLKDYQAINDYFDVSNAMKFTFGDDNFINTFDLPKMDPLTGAPKYYNPNLVWKETTPGGDEEEPTVIDVEDFGMPGMSFSTYGGFNIGKKQFDTNKDMREQYIKQFYTAIDNDDIHLLEDSLDKLVMFDKKYEAYRTVLNRINGLDERRGLEQNGIKSLKSLLIPDIRNTQATTIIGTGTFFDDDKLNTYKNQVKKQNAYKSAIYKDIGEEDEWMFGQPYSTMQVNGINIDPNSTDWNQVGEALKEGQKRAQENAKKTVVEPMQDSFLSEIDVALFNNIGTNLNNKTQVGGYEQGREVVDNIKQRLDSFISSKVDTLYGRFGDRDNSNITDKLGGWSDKLTDATDTLQGFSVYLQEASELFPPLSVAVLGLETVITTITKINQGSQALSSFLDIGKSLKAGETFEFLGQTFSSSNNAGKMLMSVTGIVGETVETLTTIFWEFLGPIALITAGLVAIKGALDWSYQSHQKYLKSLEEEQKEKRSKAKGLQTTNENAQELVRNNRAPRQQAALDRNAQLAQTRLDNANMTRSYGAIEITRQKNDTLWGDYGIAAGLGKLQGNYESTAAEYDGTSGQIRRIKEATLANPFSSDAMNQVSSYYDANQLAFGVMDEYKDELGKLYDSETSAMLKYHNDDVRGSPEFQKALDDFVEATGITRDHAKQYLDYMQTEHEVDKATQSMQAQADQIAASTELKVQAIAFGGNPADVLGLNGIEAQQDSMIKAQADMIKMELSGQLWWKAVWSTITTPIKLILSPIFIIVDLLNAIWSLMTGNIGGAFESGGRAASRLNVFGEAATYWGAWADTEATDFNAIGQNATDSYNRANYGNVEQPASGGYHPTHYVDANQGQDRREAFTHYTNANRGSYHFFNGGGQSSQPTTQLNPISSIGTMLSTIISILTTGLLVGGGIYGLTKLLKSDFSIGDIVEGIKSGNILGTIKDGGAKIFGGLFKEGTILGKLKDKVSPYTDTLKGTFGVRSGQIKKFFGLDTDNIKDSGKNKFSKLQNEAQAYLRDPETADGASWQAKMLGKITVAKEDFLGKNAWGNYLGEKIMTDDFSKRKRKGMNAEDRDYLMKRYGLENDEDILNARSSKQKNKILRNKLDDQGKWDEAMLDLHNNRYMGDSIKRRAMGVASDYVNPWKEYLGNKVDEKKTQAQEYWKNLQVDAAAYYERPDLFEDASSPVKAMAKAYEIKDQIFGKASKTDFSGLLNNPKEFLSDPRNIENMAKDLYTQHKDKIDNSDFMATVGAYRERPDFMEDAPIHAKLAGKALDWKDKYLQGDSISDVLKDPERTVDILQGTWQDLQGGALDDLNIGETVKNKVSNFFNDIKEGAEEGIDDDEEGGNGGLIERAKKKLAGFFGFGKEDISPVTKEEMEEKEAKGDFQSISDWKKQKVEEIQSPSLTQRIKGKLGFGGKEESEEAPISNISKMMNMDVEGKDALTKSGLLNGHKGIGVGNTFVESSPGAMNASASILPIDEEESILPDISGKDISKGGKGLSKIGKSLSGKGGKLGKVGNVMSKLGGGMSKAGSKGLGGVAKGGIGKLAKGGVGKGLNKVGGKIAGKIGGKVASKALAQVGSKVLGGALMATGIGAPLGLLLESPIGGFLMEGAMNLGGKALGAIGGAVGGIGNAIGGLLGFGKKTHYQQAGAGKGFGMPGLGIGGIGMAGMAAGGIAGLMGMGVGLLGSIFKNNRDHKNQSSGIEATAKRILSKVSDANKPKSNNNSGGNITIQNININTADDPEAIKAMFLELLIELQEQVNPRVVSRTVGEPPAGSSTNTDTIAENEANQNANDSNNNMQNNTQNNNSNTTTNN